MGHALLSPSSAERWMACTPSARLEEKMPNTTSVYAEEGTVAHDFAANIVLYHNKLIKRGEYEAKRRTLRLHERYNEEMEEHAKTYKEYIDEQMSQAKKVCKDPLVSVEQKLDLTAYVPEGFGTADCIIIADNVLNIIDYKYGKGVAVSAEENKQMMLYALGALDAYEFIYDIETVKMTIVQPRLDSISEFEMKAKDLKKWAIKELKIKAEMADKGEGEHVAGDHCRFCKVKATCRARAEANQELAELEFKDVDFLSDDEIEKILQKAKEVKQWYADVEEYALKEAVQNNKKWTGFKLVEGRSVRAYSDQDKVVETLTEAGYSEAVLFEKKLLGITAMEKAIGKKNFNSLLKGVIIKPQGKPTLVDQSDKRAEWNSAEIDFKIESEELDNE